SKRWVKKPSNKPGKLDVLFISEPSNASLTAQRPVPSALDKRSDTSRYRLDGRAEISGKNRKTPLDIVAGAIPVQKCSNSESMTEVVQARSTAIELTSQAHLPRQSMERPADVVLVQSSSSFGNEEKVRGWL